MRCSAIPLFVSLFGAAIVAGDFKLPDATVGNEIDYWIPYKAPANLKIIFETYGTRPDGVSVGPDGHITGLPAKPGSFTFTITAKVGDATVAGHGYQMMVKAPLVELLDPQKASIVELADPQLKNCEGVPCSSESSTRDRENVVTMTPVERQGEQFRAIVGLQQSGASGADNASKFFFDFYVSRPLPTLFRTTPGQQEPLLRWWGNVRIGSAPVTANTALLLSALRTLSGGLKLNELAQSAEFLTGLDVRLGDISSPVWGQSANSRQRFRLSFISAFGATGDLNKPPQAAPTTLTLPGALAKDQIVRLFPTAANSAYQYISFIPPAESRYSLEYFGGFRVTTRYADTYGNATTAPPAIVSFTAGQNQLLTPGRFRGLVNRVEAFYPLSTSQSNVFSAIYLFGTAQLRFGGTQVPTLPPLSQPAAGVTPIPSMDNTLYIVDRSSRDFYNIGVGVDLVRVFDNAKISFGK